MRGFFLLSIWLALFFNACSYKPSSVYQRKIIGKEINANVNISSKTPKESAYLKDALYEAVYTVFGSNIAKKGYNTTIDIDISSSYMTPLDYDENGFPILYRSSVTLKAKVVDKFGKIRNYTVNGVYDFAISANSVINDQTRFDSFKKASLNALNILLAEITKDGAYHDN